jgi:probable HAF family extracellular repeat protein
MGQNVSPRSDAILASSSTRRSRAVSTEPEPEDRGDPLPVYAPLSSVRATVAAVFHEGAKQMRIRSCILLALLFGCGHGFSATTLYSVTNLGTLPGFPITLGSAINDAGQVTGRALTRPPKPIFTIAHAFLYSNGEIMDLGTLDGISSVGNGINNAGQVTGTSPFIAGSGQAFLYSNGQMTGLGTLGGNRSFGNRINNAGQVVGDSETPNSVFHAFLYSNGQMTDLGTLGGNSSGDGINDVGQITGFSETPPGANTPFGAFHAFLYSNGEMMDLGTLGGSESRGLAINNAGQVTGFSNTTSDASDHAFLFSNGRMIDLGSFGGCCSEGLGINNAGQVVGDSESPDSVSHAFLYSNGQVIDLNSLIDPTLGIYLYTATAINDHGQIVATSDAGAVLLTPVSESPVPEPRTWTLLSLPLLTLLLRPIARREMS